MHIDGGCHCGRVRFEADVDPAQVSICHCTDCQQLCGSPYRVTVAVERAKVVLTGTPREYVKVAESGRRRRQGFCGDCGTQLYATGEGEAAAVIGLRWGAIRQRAELEPSRQIWCRSAAPWVAEVADLPAKDTA